MGKRLAIVSVGFYSITILIGLALLFISKQVKFDFKNIDEMSIIYYADIDTTTGEYQTKQLNVINNQQMLEVAKDIVRDIKINPDLIYPVDSQLHNYFCYELKSGEATIRFYFLIKNQNESILYIEYQKDLVSDLNYYYYKDTFTKDLIKIKNFFENNI